MRVEGVDLIRKLRERREEELAETFRCDQLVTGYRIGKLINEFGDRTDRIQAQGTSKIILDVLRARDSIEVGEISSN